MKLSPAHPLKSHCLVECIVANAEISKLLAWCSVGHKECFWGSAGEGLRATTATTSSQLTANQLQRHGVTLIAACSEQNRGKEAGRVTKQQKLCMAVNARRRENACLE